MIPFKLPSWAPQALGLLLLLAATVALKVAGNKIDDLKTTITAQKTTIGGLQDRVRSDATLIAQRDALIAKQNTAVEALATAAKANREAYVSRLVAAEGVAKTAEGRAAALLAIPTPDADELAQCRAATALILETIK